MQNSGYESEKGKGLPFHRSRRSGILKSAVRVVILAVILAAAFVIVQKKMERDAQVSAFHATVEHQLSAIQELTTYSYTYSDFAIRESSRSFAGIKMPGTTNTIIIVYNGTIKAGFDLSDVEIETDEDTKTVHITLPDVSVFSNEIDTDSIRTYEFNNIFNPITGAGFIEDLQKEKASHLEKAKEEGLLKLAEEHAKQTITTLFSAFDGYGVVYESGGKEQG